MFGIEKKETVYLRRGAKAEWKAAKAALKEAGITGIHAASYEDTAPSCGCGAKLDIRDFGPNGKQDRSMYYIDVPVSQKEKAAQILREAGLPETERK